MRFTEAVQTCLRKYATFSGRASRPEYWWFVLFLFLGGIVASIIDGALFGSAEVSMAPGNFAVDSNGPLGGIFSLATFIPALAAAWRRMHDTGRSGLFVLYPLIVMIGMLTFLGFVTGFQGLLSGDLAAVFAGGAGLIVLLTAVVLLISPLLVLWWLTRPSQPGPNAYGPNTHEVTS